MLKISPLLQKALILFLVLGLTALAYLPIFSNEFVSDDIDFITGWPEIRSIRFLPDLLLGSTPEGHSGVFRPIRSLFYVGMQLAFGQQPFFYHLFALTVHLTATLFVFFILQKLVKSKPAATIGSLVFGLVPVHTEAITFTTTSFDVVGIVFLFCSFYFFLRHNETKKKRPLLFAWACALVAFFTYEMTLVLPLLVVSYSLLQPRHRGGIASKTFPFWFMAFGYIVIRLLVLGLENRGSYINGSFIDTMLVSLKTLPLYIKQTVFPVRLSLDHTIPYHIQTFSLPQFTRIAVAGQRIFELPVLLSLGLLLVILTAVFSFWKKRPLVCFALLWFLISLLPVLNIIPSYAIFFEKYAYLASFGYVLLVSLWIKFSMKQKGVLRYATILGIILLTSYYGYKTYERNHEWRSEITLWETTVKASPTNPLNYFMLGNALTLKGETDAAVEQYRKALHINPNLPFVHTNLGIALITTDIAGAESHLLAAYELDRNSVQTLLSLGQLYRTYGEYTKAYDFLLQAYTLLPEPSTAQQLTQTCILLAEDYRRLGYFQPAVEFLEKALGYNPHSVEALNNLASLKALLGDSAQAGLLLHKALTLDPENPEVILNLEKLEQIQNNGSHGD